jgi:hypothetical protein
MNSWLNESTVVRIHSGGVPINTERVGDHDVDDNIVH